MTDPKYYIGQKTYKVIDTIKRVTGLDKAFVIDLRDGNDRR